MYMYKAYVSGRMFQWISPTIYMAWKMVRSVPPLNGILEFPLSTGWLDLPGFVRLGSHYFKDGKHRFCRSRLGHWVLSGDSQQRFSSRPDEIKKMSIPFLGVKQHCVHPSKNGFGKHEPPAFPTIFTGSTGQTCCLRGVFLHLLSLGSSRDDRPLTTAWYVLPGSSCVKSLGSVKSTAKDLVQSRAVAAM